MVTVTRDEHNPLLTPIPTHPWESAASFNGCPVKTASGISLLYRAMSGPDAFSPDRGFLSTIGIAHSKDGIHFKDREQFIMPDQEFDRFGCEDPRVTKINGKYYIFYTALSTYPFSADGIKVAVAISKDLKTIEEKHLVTPFNAKAMTLFPQKIGGKFVAMLSINSDRPPSELCIVTFDKIEDLWDTKKWEKWYKSPRKDILALRRLGDDHVEYGAPPLLTKKGWLVFYSHIQHYGSQDPVFGIESILLDKNNPSKIIGRTKGPLLAPEWHYEKIGLVQNITFPSGALIVGKNIRLYYGAADTYCAAATIPLEQLIEMLSGTAETFVREKNNPIIIPREGVAWEKNGTLNPAAIELGGGIHILYRAVADNNFSTIGYAFTKDGKTIIERSSEPMYKPRTDFEKAGCEDPRVMKIGNRIYMLYTAYDGSVPRVAGTWITEKDFLEKKWDKWSMPSLITTSSVDEKDAAIVPKKVKGGYLVLHRAGKSICADLLTTLDFEHNQIKKCIRVLPPRFGMWDNEKVGIATPLIETTKGYIMLYHGISWNKTYRIGVALLDLKDPTIVLARTALPIFEPQEKYEKEGIMPNVVFPCGAVVRKGILHLYYGGADKVVAVATIKVKTILHYLSVA